MKHELVICRGVPASGKSTYAQAWVAAGEKRVRVNRDDIRFQMYGVYHGGNINEEMVTRIEDAMIDTALKAGNSVIVDDTNIKHAYVKRIAAIGHKYHVDVEVKTFYVTAEEAIRRNALRDRQVPEEVIRDMVKRLHDSGAVDVSRQDVTIADKYEAKPGTFPAIIVDIDGTIAHNNGHRSFYDWSRVGGDDPIPEVIQVVKWADENDYIIIVLSGRDGICEPETREWLAEHNVPHDFFFMREAGDQRKDNIVKREIFDREIRDNFDVKFVLDDRNQVVEMWRDLGLRVFQVAPGDF
jgi:predicted kinase